MNCNKIIHVSDAGGVIPMGVWDTLNVREQRFDYSEWLEKYDSDGSGHLSILVVRPGEAIAYEAAQVETSDGVATWTFDETDTAIAGYGSCALAYYVGDTLKARTVAFDTYVDETVGMSGTDVPDPLESWFNRVLQASADAQDARDEAQEAAEKAEDSLDKQAYPNPETGTWWRWNSATGRFEDTGAPYAGTGITYIHTQRAAAKTWTITHNLGKYPSVTVVDSAGSAVIGDVTYIDELSLTVTFSGAFSGKAYLN